ncbi:hypothetical protein BN890_36530 [Bacteroides xylanisolvens SD CC 1b]|uniref:Uncharacterized protein n=1 Tax=Bacteroides xylanisolvens SD CC 1b TaxID=702447 RepID=W6P7I6_9BACE|nr:hypothetical protein [Bacteroides xylanisolvens]MDB0709057.1 hypothetical protein [Bacteroides xylanisolvens]CDM00648.1 hypothetical protein BN891_35730 [Bacteroides xylanisolvens SD CC 2a]CDM06051.1 hypothetical protein BN890_36530 [Bacteroides xylanisolvens SD CC 1b]
MVILVRTYFRLCALSCGDMDMLPLQGFSRKAVSYVFFLSRWNI